MIDLFASAEESAAFTIAMIRDHPVRVPLLMGMVAIFPLMYGYTARIYRGGSKPPDLSKPLELLIDGIRLIFVSFIYALPFVGAVIIVGSQGDLLLNLITHAESGLLFSEIGVVFFLIVGIILLYAVVILFSMIGVIRTARTKKIRDAFAFAAILAHISRIGGVSYLSAVVFYTVIAFLASLPAGYMMELSLLGYIPAFFIYAMVTVFAARYFTLVFESGLPDSSDQ
ncbi:DUF4013 domain-containing protein [Methanocalculus taiwanensis]|uniref:DUF4013 domain-containing protein n=1 Tax=Methanocalculus taiwanensis TaxID=106207 RepID=A0ABD4TLZ9_9EURY|nr:DUF4013 domain-containing protein [Methanocalculus taiwanensis]MCQ1539018.1 DUF4013 domain-containing protein [Methanocalculus taiwanensis]